MYLLYGDDTQKARDKCNALIDSLEKRKPDASLFRITDETFEPSQLDELLYGQGLFEHKYIVSCAGVCRNAEFKKLITSALKDVAASDNIFVFLEESLDAKSKKAFEKHAEKVQVFEKKKVAKESFNLFALTDALGERNRAKLWTLYQEALRNNISAEEVHGVLFWQIKSLLLAQHADSPEEAGLKPFPFKKAKSFLKNFSPEELCVLSKQLVELYHSARKGKYDLDIALEQFVLGV